MAVLGDYIRIKHGFAFKGDFITTEDNGIVLVTPGNFEIGGGFKEKKCKFFSGDYPAEYVLCPGDLIVTMTDLSKQGDTLGFSALVPNSQRTYLHNQRIGLVDVFNPEADREFIYWFMRTPRYQKTIVATASGSTVKHTSPSRICEVEIDLPPLNEQKAIAAILTAIDAKIAVNEKINDNLQQQAQNVFADWFLRFTPFVDDEFVDSPIDTKIPKSLSMVQIGDVPHILETGRRPKGGAANCGVPSVGAENVKQLGKFDFSSKKFIPEDFAAKQKTGRIKGYELLLYKDGGKPGTFIPHFSMFGERFPYTDFFINEHVFKLDFFDRGKNIFAYFYMLTDYATSWLANNGGKAAIPGINQQDVRSIWIFDLDHPQVHRFGRWVEPLFKTIFCNCYENMRLAELRDALLPKLMSGEIDVSDIQF